MNLDFRKIGKWIANVLIFLVLLGILIIPAVYTNSIFGYFPILATVFLHLVSLVYLLVMRKSIVIESDHQDVEVERGDTVRVDLGIRNKSFLVCTKAKAEIYVQDFLG